MTVFREKIFVGGIFSGGISWEGDGGRGFPRAILPEYHGSVTRNAVHPKNCDNKVSKVTTKL